MVIFAYFLISSPIIGFFAQLAFFRLPDTTCNQSAAQANFLFHAIISCVYICVLKLRISHKCHKTFPAICNVSIFLDNCGLGKIIIMVANEDIFTKRLADSFQRVTQPKVKFSFHNSVNKSECRRVCARSLLRGSKKTSLCFN